MTYEQAVQYLLTLGRELASPQQARATKFDLENITALATRLGNPQRFVPCVHIAGTNGKGSTAAMLASVLSAAGLRVGLYTSPHLVRINERIRLFEPFSSLAAPPPFFECVTAMAFYFFASQKADIAVYEVGLGGRLDSTNIVVPEVAVI